MRARQNKALRQTRRGIEGTLAVLGVIDVRLEAERCCSPDL
jgi:hypothetical protein